MTSVDGPKGKAWWDRADRVLPGGMVYFSRSARFAGEGVLPGFIERAEGARITDVDGRSYIDFLCANGPILLGHRHPYVEAEAEAQRARADSASFFPPALVELSERLVERTPGMSWAIPAKNGSDVIGLAVRAVRAATDRDTIVQFERAYHGFDPELVPGGAGVPAAVRANVAMIRWNGANELEDFARENGKGLAGILLNPIDQNPAMDVSAASPDFIAAIDRVRERTGAKLILDDVRHGFRIHTRGSHAALGIEPDLIGLGKALGNGYPVAALLGSEPMREAARKLAFTSTYVFTAVPLAAARATVETYDREKVFDRLEAAGNRLRDGFLRAAEAAGHAIRYTGPVACPVMLFEDDPGLEKGRAFSQSAALNGAIFHPNLNWFINAAHDDATIDEAIEIAAQAFREVSG